MTHKILWFSRLTCCFCDMSSGTVSNKIMRVSRLLPRAYSSLHKPSISEISEKLPKPGEYKRSTPPVALPLSKILTEKLFPLSVSESFKDFSYCKDLDKVQNELLSSLPFHNKVESNPEFGFKRKSEILKIDIGNGNYINEFFIRPKNDIPYEKLNHFVLVHGYGAGLGFFLKNFNELSSNENWAIHSIDLLGYGCSSRPNIDFKIDSIENFFIDSLEKWRVKRNLDQVLMCSHSLGAYVSLLYIKKYPNVVKNLLLASPAGIIKPSTPLKNVPVWFEYLWNQRVSPFSLVRNSGPFGSLLTSGWSYRRFSKLSKTEQDLLHKYTYSIFNSKGSGEYFLNDILAVGGVPKNPLVDRAEELINCDTTWIYGDDDWIPKEGGLVFKNKITNYNVDLKIVKNSGHHLYLDNYNDFNKICLESMKEYEKKYSK